MPKMEIDGVIGWDVTAKEVKRELKGKKGDLDVHLNTPGGSIYQGIEIYNAFKDYDGDVTMHIGALAASMGSYIAMAGSKITARENSTFMIHNGWTIAMGDHNSLRKEADELESLTAMLRKAYVNRTGEGDEAIKNAMDDESYYFGEEIKDALFADEIVDAEDEAEKDQSLALAKAAMKSCQKIYEEHLKESDSQALTDYLAAMPSSEKIAKSKKGDSMPEPIEKQPEDLQAVGTKEGATAGNADTVALQKKVAEMERKDAIRDLSDQYKPSAELKEKFLVEGSPEAYKSAILDEKMAVQPDVQVGENIGKQHKEAAMVDGLAMRLGLNVDGASNEAHRFANMSMVEGVRAMTGEYDMTRDQLAKLAMSSSDFPKILSGVTNKMLKDAFETADVTYRKWCQEADVPDFKTVTEVGKGALSTLQKQYEGGEVKKKEIKEDYETWNLDTYAGEIAMTRQMIIDDNLGRFSGKVSEMADAGFRTANELAYSVLTNNAAMSDGTNLFAAGHSNYTSSGTAITHAALSAARALMRKQKDINGVSLNVAPRYLIVSPDKETEALQLLSTSNLVATGDTDATVATANTFVGSLKVIVDATLTGNTWYLAASRNTVKVGYLAGTGRVPTIEEKMRSTASGIVYEVVYDLGAVATDYRGLYKNAGA